MTAAVEGTIVVGLAIAGPTDANGRCELLALGVAPAFRHQGLGTALLEACVTSGTGATEYTADITLAERDPVEPLDRALRGSIARQLLVRAGFEIRRVRRPTFGSPTPAPSAPFGRPVG